jgi:molybdopterin-biosynthesis enzyme MoeA-like protein
MADRPILPRSLVRRAENVELSLGSLEAISELRAYLNQLEKLSMASAREKGATVEDIAEALRLTPQAIYYRLRSEKMNLQVTPGEPNAPETTLEPTTEPALTPESSLVTSDPTPEDDSALLPDPKLPD